MPRASTARRPSPSPCPSAARRPSARFYPAAWTPPGVVGRRGTANAAAGRLISGASRKPRASGGVEREKHVLLDRFLFGQGGSVFRDVAAGDVRSPVPLTSVAQATLPCGLFHLRPPRDHLHAPLILHDRGWYRARKSVPINSPLD